MANANPVVARKEAELAELEAKGRPLAILLAVLGVITILSAIGGAAFGVAKLPLVTAVTTPLIVLVVFMRLPEQQRAAGLLKEIQQLSKE